MATETPPFYAVRIMPGDIGSYAGLDTDGAARVLDTRGTLIPGLYAAGADSVSVGSGSYPGTGGNIGPAMTFGYIAAQHVAARLGMGGERARATSSARGWRLPDSD